MVSGLGWGEEDARVTCRQLQLPEDGDYKADCMHEATFVSGNMTDHLCTLCMKFHML